MGTIVFWIVLGIIVLSLVVSNYKKSLEAQKAREDEIRSYFGKLRDAKDIEHNSHIVIKNYCEYQRNIADKSDFYIDEITYNDLSLDVIYDLLNTTFTSAGEEVLYKKLRITSLNGKSQEDFYSRVSFYKSADKVRVEHSLQLDRLGKIKNISSFDIIQKLFQANTHDIKRDLLIDVLLILAFCFIFIIPALGFISFLVLLIVSISNYFKEKAAMDENLKAYNYILRLIKCAQKIKCVRLDKDKYDKVLKFDFVISSKDGTNSNPLSIILDYIKMIFHVDLIAYNKGLETIITNKENILDIYEEIGTVDTAIAIASYVSSVEYSCTPKFELNSRIIEAVDMYHPLTLKAVPNSINTRSGVLITGSNASGKSTFLKMLGINVIFAQSFGFALANEFVLTPFKLYTSMALADNILGKESYYIVETRSLKRICDAANDEDNVLCIVDEVLRGTNTEERIAASTYILKYLRDNSVVCFVATHDNELTNLLADDYELYYFGEEVSENSVIFPYVIQKGVSKSGNAIKLLEVMGYDKDIVEGARKIANAHSRTGKWESN